ncbi:hypothetical protein V1477_010305 [Vespula maculifrons]|uniref:Uncharacterized protein n=1 Tax=Vespula maculifrons TaxID=7453 RepID=A0ABD2C8C4_VESMC
MLRVTLFPFASSDYTSELLVKSVQRRRQRMATKFSEKFNSLRGKYFTVYNLQKEMDCFSRSFSKSIQKEKDYV